MTGDSKEPGNSGAPGDETNHQCGAMTQNGTRCQNRALANGYCWMHSGVGQKPDSKTSPPSPPDTAPESSIPEASEEIPPPLPDTGVPPEQEVTDTEIEPVFFLESEKSDPDPPDPENREERIEEDTPIILDPSGFEFEPEPDSETEETDIPDESIIDDTPAVPDNENEISLQDDDDDVIELDLSGLDLKIEEPAVDPSTDEEIAAVSSSDDGPEADGSDEMEALPEGDIQMPESFRLELESGKEVHPEPDDISQAPEHGLEQVEMDETLELDLDLPDDHPVLAQEDTIEDASGIDALEQSQEEETPGNELEIDAVGLEIEDATGTDAPEQSKEEETPEDDLEIDAVGLEMGDVSGVDDQEQSRGEETPEDDLEIDAVGLEMESSLDISESDGPPPDLKDESPGPVGDVTPDPVLSDVENEKVVAPPQFDLFEELPGEDWIEIEVNIEDGEYSTKDLDEFAPDLLLDEDAPKTPQPERNAASPAAAQGPEVDVGFDQKDIDGDEVVQSAEMAAAGQTRSAATQLEPTHYVPAPEEPKGLLSRKISLSLPLFAVLLILIVGITYGVSTLFRPTAVVVDAGDTSIRLVDIESRFVQNQQVGNLLVITGRAINDYDHPRSFIRVTGKVYTSDRFVQSISVFCGNILTEEELQTLPTSDIVPLLLRRAGRNKSNMNISTGNAAPLMIVFPITSEMIDRLDSYTVEVVESKPS